MHGQWKTLVGQDSICMANIITLQESKAHKLHVVDIHHQPACALPAPSATMTANTCLPLSQRKLVLTFGVMREPARDIQRLAGCCSSCWTLALMPAMNLSPVYEGCMLSGTSWSLTTPCILLLLACIQGRHLALLAVTA